MKIFKTRPTLEMMGVTGGAKKYFRVVSLGNCQWDVVQKKGAPGTMRQTIRQNSSCKMRNRRKTEAKKDRVAAKLERHFNPGLMAKADKDARHLEKSNTEKWREYIET